MWTDLCLKSIYTLSIEHVVSSGGLWRVIEGYGGLWRVMEGYGGLWRVILTFDLFVLKNTMAVLIPARWYLCYHFSIHIVSS